MHLNLEGKGSFFGGVYAAQCTQSASPQPAALWVQILVLTRYVARQPAKEEVPQDDMHVTQSCLHWLSVKKTKQKKLPLTVLGVAEREVMSDRGRDSRCEHREEGIKSAGCMTVLDAFKKNSFVMFQRGNDKIIAAKTMIRWTRPT